VILKLGGDSKTDFYSPSPKFSCMERDGKFKFDILLVGRGITALDYFRFRTKSHALKREERVNGGIGFAVGEELPWCGGFDSWRKRMKVG